MSPLAHALLKETAKPKRAGNGSVADTLLRTESVNSYTLAFDSVPDGYEPSEDVEELANVIASCMPPNADFSRVPAMSGLAQEDKAWILDRCFNIANETFYELADEGMFDGMDEYEVQDEWLGQITHLLQGMV